MTTFATLPGDILTAVASYVDGPQIVVAVASDADARTALRRGVDAAEEALRGVTIREANRRLRRAELEIRIYKATVIALAPLLVMFSAVLVAHRVGWVDLKNEPWWFSFEIACSWFCLVFFCLVVAHGVVRQLRRQKTMRTVQLAAIYAIYPLLVLKVARMGGVVLPPLMQWWFTSNGSLWAYLISFALQLSLHFVMRERKEGSK